jgi:hypothetical protein
MPLLRSVVCLKWTAYPIVSKLCNLIKPNPSDVTNFKNLFILTGLLRRTVFKLIDGVNGIRCTERNSTIKSAKNLTVIFAGAERATVIKRNIFCTSIISWIFFQLSSLSCGCFPTCFLFCVLFSCAWQEPIQFSWWYSIRNIKTGILNVLTSDVTLGW